jgi:hypothetical protein
MINGNYKDKNPFCNNENFPVVLIFKFLSLQGLFV